MADAKSPPAARPRPGGRLWRWLDRRTGVDRLLRTSLDEPIPGGARLAYVFGSALLFIFLSQVVTGLCLALYYVPAPMVAQTTVAYIVKEVAAGSFLRSLHSYGSSGMVVVLVLHFLQTFLYGSYKGRRELLWISGCTLGGLVLAMAFTGYLLSWDQSAFAAGSVGTDLVGQVPFIGEKLRQLLRGGSGMGALTLSRFYLLHLFLIPGLIFALIAGHLVLFRKAGAAGPVGADPVAPRLPTGTFYPHQVLIDMGFVLLVMGVLGALSHFFPVPVGLAADPGNTGYLPRPEWYFLPFFQWLKYWEGWKTVIGMIAIPVLLAGLVFALPFLDRGTERRPWRRPIPVGAVTAVLLGVLWLGLQSRLADSRDPSTAAQLARQDNDAAVFTRARFEPYAPAGTSGAAPAANGAATAQGKALFDAQSCSTCHGAEGKGGKGPALTGIEKRFDTAHLTALLKAPTAKMIAGGMQAVALKPAELSSLVTYLGSLGGAAAAAPQSAAAGAPSAAAAPPPATAPPAPSAATAPPPATAPPAAGPARIPGKAAAASPRARAGPMARVATAAVAPAPSAKGAALYRSSGCAACHGAAREGSERAPALTSLSARFSAGQLETLLQNPSQKMQAGHMPPVAARGAELKTLVAYLREPAARSSPAVRARPQAAAAPAAPPVAPTPAAPAAPTVAPTPAAPAAPPVAPTAAAAQATGAAPASAGPAPSVHGEELFQAQGCVACHGKGGVGTARAPALTKVQQTMSPAALDALLKQPTAKMVAGGMPAVSDSATRQALIDYLRSLGGAPAQAAAGPAADSANPAGPAEPPAPAVKLTEQESQGKEIFREHACASCHGVGGAGGTVAAPALAHAHWTEKLVNHLLEEPSEAMQRGGMPPLSVSDEERAAIAAYVAAISR